jgi:hypothetical protein
MRRVTGNQELATLEAKALEKSQKIKEEAVGFYEKCHTEIIVVASLAVIQSYLN